MGVCSVHLQNKDNNQTCLEKRDVEMHMAALNSAGHALSSPRDVAVSIFVP